MRTVVLVHGAWHGPWCWASVLAGLDERGVPAVPVQLPGGDLATDASHVEDVLEHAAADGRRIVLAGHSYGGAVITEAGGHPAVDRLVYVCAFAPDDGESLADLSARPEASSAIADAVQVVDETIVLEPAKVVDALYADCDPIDVERAVGLLTPQPLASFLGTPRVVAWRMRPTTYVLCGSDRSVAPALQRWMAGRIPDVSLVEWPDASHSPMLSRPADVADLLAGLADDAA